MDKSNKINEYQVGFYNSNKSPVAVQATNDPFELSVCAWEDADNIDDVICGEYMFQVNSIQ